jgi:bacterioferritin
MKGEARVIERLNEALFLELGAVNQYWLHYRLLEDWGYVKLAKKERAESIEEMHHADKIVARIIFLEGHPNLQKVGPLRIGQNVKEVLEADLAGEYDARTSYKKSREICQEVGDYVTMKIFEELLTDEEGLEQIRKDCKMAAVTRSELGSVVVRGSETAKIDAIEIAELVDTTGAGDLYAAGFLFGYTQGRSLADCGALGSLAAGLVIQQIGPRPQLSLMEAAQQRGLI